MPMWDCKSTLEPPNGCARDQATDATSLYLRGLRPMPPPSDFRDFSDFSKISNFSKNAKNCIFINFWAPGMLNSYSAYRSGGKKWPQINFSSKLKITFFIKNPKNRIRNDFC